MLIIWLRPVFNQIKHESLMAVDILILVIYIKLTTIILFIIYNIVYILDIYIHRTE